jgi:hypothetical protein
MVFHRLLVALATTVLVSAGLASCTLPRGGLLTQNCTADVECDDGNECTGDVCTADGICSHEFLDRLPPDTAANDCMENACVDGQVVSRPNDLDFEDSPDDCVVDGCLDGAATSELLADGSGCAVAGNVGRCDGAGECVVTCTPENASERCNDDNGCTIDACDVSAGECFHESLDNVTAPGTAQVAGDCRQVACVSGNESVLIDDSDLPDDGNDCTDDICNAGAPSNDAQDIGFTCADMADALKKVCSDDGSCLQCNTPVDCDHLPADDECQTRTCIAGVCGQTFAPVDTALNSSQQDAGDCKVVVCDGAGGTKINIDDLDVPVDANDCTQDVCTNGVPSNPNEGQNTACGAGGTLVCDGNGVCVGCNNASQCEASTPCRSWACNNTVCEYTDTGAGSTAGISQIPNDCKKIQCNGVGQEETVADDVDLPVDDGNQCTLSACNAGVGSYPPQVIDTSCTQGGNYCDGNGGCVECNKGNQCSGAGVCERDPCVQKQCEILPRAAGYALPADQQTDGDCQTRVCDGMGDIDPVGAIEDLDLPVDGNACTDDVCTDGNPSNPNLGAGDPCSQNGGNVCDGAGMCIGCIVDGDCGTNQTCSASQCLKSNGQSCASTGECASGNCADGVCCNAPCTAACRACNLSGTVGTCTSHPSGTDPDGDCGSNESCDGSGACQSDGGVLCNGGSNCAAGQVCCIDSYYNTLEGCASPGNCGYYEFGAECNGPDDCPAGQVCCGDWNGYDYTAITCQNSCSNYSYGDRIMCDGDSGNCPAGRPGCYASSAISGYYYCY